MRRMNIYKTHRWLNSITYYKGLKRILKESRELDKHKASESANISEVLGSPPFSSDIVPVAGSEIKDLNCGACNGVYCTSEHFGIECPESEK